MLSLATFATSKGSGFSHPKAKDTQVPDGSILNTMASNADFLPRRLMEDEPAQESPKGSELSPVLTQTEPQETGVRGESEPTTDEKAIETQQLEKKSIPQRHAHGPGCSHGGSDPTSQSPGHVHGPGRSHGGSTHTSRNPVPWGTVKIVGQSFGGKTRVTKTADGHYVADPEEIVLGGLMEALAAVELSTRSW